MQGKRIAIVGTVGVPANYGGFETLVENLVRFHDSMSRGEQLIIYCSSKIYPDLDPGFLSAKLKYVPLSANGAQSIPYDIWSLFSAAWNKSNVILLLGVSGAIALPIIRLISSARIITNVDGIEWHRQKWSGVAKLFLRLSEMIAVRFSHDVISDNDAISEYVTHTYGVNSHVIAYGGDHVLDVDAVSVNEYALPDEYIFSVCRIEPENNVEMIVSAFSTMHEYSLVMVGNWGNSDYGRGIREHYKTFDNIYLLDPIYDLGKLKSLRANAAYYIHGHSAGGTNPSLVEAMYFGKPILAFDCSYNRSTTESSALYFSSGDEIKQILSNVDGDGLIVIGTAMLEIAKRRYTWRVIATEYFSLLSRNPA